MLRSVEVIADDDAELARSAAGGDRTAFGVLVARHRPTLLALCRRALFDWDLAEEAAQEATLQALLSLERLRDPGKFGPWLAGIGLNVARHRLRERRRDAWSWDALIGGRYRDDPIDVEPTPEERAELIDLAERVKRAIAELPPGQRGAVLLHYVSGFTHQEVGTLLGIGAGAVKARLHKARANLKGRLRSLWKEDEEMAVREEMDFVEMRVADVRRSPAREGTKERFVVLLEEPGTGRGLPMWIGTFEGTGIAFLLEKTELPRPMTHQLASDLVRAAGGRIAEVRINRLANQTFFAEIQVDGPEGTATVDARPSDALALALIGSAPIRVSTEVLQGVEREEEGSMAGFERARGGFSEGAAEIAGATKREWERSLEELRAERGHC